MAQVLAIFFQLGHGQNNVHECVGVHKGNAVGLVLRSVMFSLAAMVGHGKGLDFNREPGNQVPRKSLNPWCVHFKPCDWSMRFMKVILLVSSLLRLI